MRASALGTTEAALLRAWSAAEAALLRAWSAACGWRQRGRQRRLVYSGDVDSGSEGVGGVRGNVNGSNGVSGVWGDSGDGNGIQVRQPVSGGTDSNVRDCGGKGDVGQRKRAREVSGSEGGRVESFGL